MGRLRYSLGWTLEEGKGMAGEVRVLTRLDSGGGQRYGWGEVRVLTRLDPGGGHRKSGYLVGGEGSLEATSGGCR